MNDSGENQPGHRNGMEGMQYLQGQEAERHLDTSNLEIANHITEPERPPSKFDQFVQKGTDWFKKHKAALNAIALTAIVSGSAGYALGAAHQSEKQVDPNMMDRQAPMTQQLDDDQVPGFKPNVPPNIGDPPPPDVDEASNPGNRDLADKQIDTGGTFDLDTTNVNFDTSRGVETPFAPEGTVFASLNSLNTLEVQTENGQDVMPATIAQQVKDTQNTEGVTNILTEQIATGGNGEITNDIGLNFQDKGSTFGVKGAEVFSDHSFTVDAVNDKPADELFMDLVDANGNDTGKDGMVVKSSGDALGIYNAVSSAIEANHELSGGEPLSETELDRLTREKISESISEFNLTFDENDNAVENNYSTGATFADKNNPTKETVGSYTANDKITEDKWGEVNGIDDTSIVTVVRDEKGELTVRIYVIDDSKQPDGYDDPSAYLDEEKNGKGEYKNMRRLVILGEGEQPSQEKTEDQTVLATEPPPGEEPEVPTTFTPTPDTPVTPTPDTPVTPTPDTPVTPTPDTPVTPTPDAPKPPTPDAPKPPTPDAPKPPTPDAPKPAGSNPGNAKEVGGSKLDGITGASNQEGAKVPPAGPMSGDPNDEKGPQPPGDAKNNSAEAGGGKPADAGGGKPAEAGGGKP